MLYQYVKRYLKNTFIQPEEDFEWSILNNIHFFAFIDARYSNEEFEKEISEVKEAFRDFIEPIGKLVFHYKKESGIKLKIFPYRVKPENSKHLKNIIKIINKNKNKIKYPYKGQNDQIAILGKIRREFNREVSNTQESVNKKALFMHAIRIALSLSENDVITQFKRMYIIKIFKKNTKLNKSSEVILLAKREGVENRFNGYPLEKIEEIYKQIFDNKKAKISDFLVLTMKNVFNESLNFRVINNQYYELNVLKVIHTGISNELHNYIELENDYILGVTGYLMRKHFYEIHELMAIELIECVYEKDRNANKFLLYYNGKTILVENKKYTIPCLETKDGRQWNSSSLIGICNLWMSTKRRKELFEYKLVEVNMKLSELQKKLEYIQPERDAQEKIISETLLEYDVIAAKHAELESKLKYLEVSSLNSSEYFALEAVVAESNIGVVELEGIMNTAKSNLTAIKDANTSTYSDLDYFTNQKNQYLHDIKAQSLNIDTKSTQIDPIIESIVNVLMKRTEST